MSLPLNSPQSNHDPLDESMDVIIGRKMDFALCKFRTFLFLTLLFKVVHLTIISAFKKFKLLIDACTDSIFF